MTKADKIKIVKQKLWYFKYAVRDFSLLAFSQFDLGIESKYRVIVGTKCPKPYPNFCDVFAEVDSQGVRFVTPAGKKYKSPYDVFGRNKYQHNGNHTTKQNDRPKPDHESEAKSQDKKEAGQETGN